MSVDAPRNPEPSDRRSSTLPALAGTGAVLAAAGLVLGVTLTSGSGDTMPVAQAAPSTTATTTATTTPTSTAASSTYKADAKGYVDTKARCDDSQSVMVYGRTERSLMAICVDPDGALEYRGVRLSDNASLKLTATRGSDGSVTANNDGGVTYSISPKVFLVSEGDNVIYRDSWVEFVQPGFSGSSTSSPTTSTTATTSGSATTTVSTTTVTVTTSVTPTSKPGG